MTDNLHTVYMHLCVYVGRNMLNICWSEVRVQQQLRTAIRHSLFPTHISS